MNHQIAHADPISMEALSDPYSPFTNRILEDRVTEQEFNRLPFGAIQLDTAGRIIKYNDFESNMAGVQKIDAIGKNFFTEVAPCTNVKAFYGRFIVGVDKKNLHEKFRYHFSFKNNPVDVTVTLFYCDKTQRVWVFVRPVAMG